MERYRGDHDASYYGSFRSFDPYAFSMGFSPVLGCELAAAVPLRQLVDEWIDPVRRVVSIATGRSEEITYLTVYPVTDSGGEREGQLFGPGVTQEPYESTREDVESRNFCAGRVGLTGCAREPRRPRSGAKKATTPRDGTSRRASRLDRRDRSSETRTGTTFPKEH